MCHMCYVISAWQAGASGINKHAAEITEQEHTHTHTDRVRLLKPQGRRPCD